MILQTKAWLSAKRLLEEADEAMKKANNDSENPWMRMLARGADINSALQLYITTKDKNMPTGFGKKSGLYLNQTMRRS